MKENQLQRAAVNFFRHAWPHVALHHVPNGGTRPSGREVRELKRQGLTPGIPDLSIPWPSGGYPGLYVELKVGKNVPSEDQEKQIKKLHKAGYLVAVVYTFEEFEKLVISYMDVGLVDRESLPIKRVLELVSKESGPYKRYIPKIAA